MAANRMECNLNFTRCLKGPIASMAGLASNAASFMADRMRKFQIQQPYETPVTKRALKSNANKKYSY